MIVKYYHQTKDVIYGNIIWHDAPFLCSCRMRRGKFPANHPCAPGVTIDASPAGCFGSGAKLDLFRAHGYWASCSPEGDGIAISSPGGRTAKQVAADIVECFGWDVKIMRDETGKEVSFPVDKPE